MTLNSRIIDLWLGVKAHMRTLDLTVRAVDPEGPWKEQAGLLRISFNENLRLNRLHMI